MVCFQETTQKCPLTSFPNRFLSLLLFLNAVLWHPSLWKPFFLHLGLRCTRLLHCDAGHYWMSLCCWERANPELKAFGVTEYDGSARMRLGSNQCNIHPKKEIFSPSQSNTVVWNTATLPEVFAFGHLLHRCLPGWSNESCSLLKSMNFTQYILCTFQLLVI